MKTFMIYGQWQQRPYHCTYAPHWVLVGLYWLAQKVSGRFKS